MWVISIGWQPNTFLLEFLWPIFIIVQKLIRVMCWLNWFNSINLIDPIVKNLFFWLPWVLRVSLISMISIWVYGILTIIWGWKILNLSPLQLGTFELWYKTKEAFYPKKKWKLEHNIINAKLIGPAFWQAMDSFLFGLDKLSLYYYMPQI